MQFQRDYAFYARLFAQIFLYLKQFGGCRWRAAVIYPDRNAEQPSLIGYEDILDTGFIARIYLNELPDLKELDAEVSIFKLIVEPEITAVDKAKDLIEQAPESLNFIERVFFYNLNNERCDDGSTSLARVAELLTHKLWQTKCVLF